MNGACQTTLSEPELDISCCIFSGIDFYDSSVISGYAIRRLVFGELGFQEETHIEEVTDSSKPRENASSYTTLAGVDFVHD
jgi:hypothetical protein